MRKIPAILHELTRVGLTQSAITQDAMKQVTGPVGQRYEELREQAFIHTDDTGWRVCGEQAFLTAFVNQSLSVYQIRSRHRNQEVRELIPADFAGVMVCDRGKSYDATELREVAQEHHLRNRIFRDDENQRLLNGVGIQSDREQLLRFLHTEGVEPTNNRAERGLRPAVIASKVSQCSMTRYPFRGLNERRRPRRSRKTGTGTVAVA